MTQFIGVDIGGTFTDLVIQDEQGLRIHKLLSTPQNPADAMLAGLSAIQAQPSARLSHGSTVATNAILERKGARTALITTQGFRDILAIGRQNRPQLYALHPQLPPPLIPRQWCFEVAERLSHQGEVLTPLHLPALDDILAQIQAEKIEAVAVCLLYSYLNPLHEYLIRERILETGLLADWQISLSCEVLPKFREYERASTTALDAYVRPIMSRYLSELETRLAKTNQLWVMKSDGGVISATGARAQAVQTALSGPAAGVIGAVYWGKLAGFENIITLDMGGTSTDVALCPGQTLYRRDAEIDGLPLHLPLIDIETVGAGGGSLARLDAGGALRVGPQSAGANPGPISYGQGGTQITVSDANALLGRLDPDYFLGGKMHLKLEPVQKAFEALAKNLGISPEQAALGVLEVANVNIDRAIRRVSIARGYDPREFTLMAFGGAGGLHACEVAERLEMPLVLIPRYGGVMCALGLLAADVQRNYTQPAAKNLAEQLEVMLLQAQNDLSQEGIPSEKMQFKVWVDMRYQGQSYELSIPYQAAESLNQAFHQQHQAQYAYALEDHPIESTNLHLQAIGQIDKPIFKQSPVRFNDGSNALLGHKQGLALYAREGLQPGAVFAGPALVFQLDSTTYIPPYWQARVDAYHNLILAR